MPEYFADTHAPRETVEKESILWTYMANDIYHSDRMRDKEGLEYVLMYIHYYTDGCCHYYMSGQESGNSRPDTW